MKQEKTKRRDILGATIGVVGSYVIGDRQNCSTSNDGFIDILPELKARFPGRICPNLYAVNVLPNERVTTLLIGLNGPLYWSDLPGDTRYQCSGLFVVYPVAKQEGQQFLDHPDIEGICSAAGLFIPSPKRQNPVDNHS